VQLTVLIIVLHQTQAVRILIIRHRLVQIHFRLGRLAARLPDDRVLVRHVIRRRVPVDEGRRVVLFDGPQSRSDAHPACVLRLPVGLDVGVVAEDVGGEAVFWKSPESVSSRVCLRSSRRTSLHIAYGRFPNGGLFRALQRTACGKD
jgi:hypothetical protein